MARPRKPAADLELTGAFRKNPQRRRVDPQGAGEFDSTPPDGLDELQRRAWATVVAQVPPGVLSGSDRLSVEVAARLLAQIWSTNDPKIMPEFRQWVGQLGLSPVARAKLSVTPPKTENPFAKFGRKDEDRDGVH